MRLHAFYNLYRKRCTFRVKNTHAETCSHVCTKTHVSQVSGFSATLCAKHFISAHALTRFLTKMHISREKRRRHVVTFVPLVSKVSGFSATFVAKHFILANACQKHVTNVSTNLYTLAHKHATNAHARNPHTYGIVLLHKRVQTRVTGLDPHSCKNVSTNVCANVCTCACVHLCKCACARNAHTLVQHTCTHAEKVGS